MYQCIGCGGFVENISGTCFCGKTSTDHKGNVKGENYVEIDRQKVLEKTKIRKCPYCGWEGLVIPRIGVGCPDHGVWWYKKYEENQTIIGETHEPVEDQHPDGWVKCNTNRPNRREKGRGRQKPKRVRRYNLAG